MAGLTARIAGNVAVALPLPARRGIEPAIGLVTGNDGLPAGGGRRIAPGQIDEIRFVGGPGPAGPVGIGRALRRHRLGHRTHQQIRGPLIVIQQGPHPLAIAAQIGIPRGRDEFTVVSHIHDVRQRQLLLVADATRLLRARLGRGQRRQQHGRQNGDDGNDHEQFNQSKTCAGMETILGMHMIFSKADKRQAATAGRCFFAVDYKI